MRAWPLLFLLVAVTGCRHSVAGPDAGTALEGEGASEGEGDGCGSPVNGLIVVAIDSATQFNVCGAAATYSEAGNTETLEQTGTTQADCQYEGAADEPGTYEINVTHDGYAPFSLSNVVVAQEQDACGHAVPRTVTAFLNPA